MDANLLGLQGSMKLSGRGVAAMVGKATFSSLRVSLVAKKDASCR